MPPRGEIVEVRFVQEREWRASLDGCAHQNLFYAWSIDTARASAADVRHAVGALARRHESMRLEIREEAGAVVGLVWSDIAVPWQELDLRGLTATARARVLDHAVTERLSQRFDLGTAPLWRATLIHLDARSALLVLIVAHTIWDVHSTSVFTRELNLLLAGSGGLPPLRVQPADVAALERNEPAPASQAYWAVRHRGRPARGGDERYAPAEFAFEVASAVTGRRLVALAHSEGTTANAVFAAAFRSSAALLDEDEESMLGVLDARRAEPDIEPLIGYFADLDLLPMNVSQLPLPASTRALDRELRAAYAHPCAAEYQADASADLARPACTAICNFVPGHSGRWHTTPDPVATPVARSPAWMRWPARSGPWGADVELEIWAGRDHGATAAITYNSAVHPRSEIETLASRFRERLRDGVEVSHATPRRGT